MALTISSGAWLMAYGGPDIAQVWFPEHPIMSTLGMFSFLAWVLNIVQMGLNSND
jgi:hypothetical protein